ncbi:MAG: type II secretion system protein [Thermoanaerobaculia bacterium]|jgi:general secretion pathway protein G
MVSARKAQRGFTLIELLVVVTIIGILAGIAVVNVKHARRKAAESVLKANLALMRKGIDDYYADKQKYPASLQELVEAKYMRKIPPDPITESAETWIEVREEVLDQLDQQTDFAAGPAEPGIVDVKSGAEGSTLMGEPYGEL